MLLLFLLVVHLRLYRSFQMVSSAVLFHLWILNLKWSFDMNSASGNAQFGLWWEIWLCEVERKPCLYNWPEQQPEKANYNTAVKSLVHYTFYLLIVFNFCMHLTFVFSLFSRPPAKPGDPELTDWTKVDFDNVFSSNASNPGWCNVDPQDAYSSGLKIKENCHCKYDCTWGRFCEIPTMCSCLNQCSGHGHCRGGFCQVHTLFNSLN